MFSSHISLTPERQAHIYATGLLTIVTLGTLAMIAACLVALWALVQFATLLLESVVQCCSTIGTTYAAADPLVKLLILVSIAFAMYHLARRARR